jgi:hypothetical protein
MSTQTVVEMHTSRTLYMAQPPAQLHRVHIQCVRCAYEHDIYTHKMFSVRVQLPVVVCACCASLLLCSSFYCTCEVRHDIACNSAKMCHAQRKNGHKTYDTLLLQRVRVDIDDVH